MEIILSPPFAGNAFIETFLLSFRTVVRLNSGCALTFLIVFSISSHYLCSSSEFPAPPSEGHKIWVSLWVSVQVLCSDRPLLLATFWHMGQFLHLRFPSWRMFCLSGFLCTSGWGPSSLEAQGNSAVPSPYFSKCLKICLFMISMSKMGSVIMGKALTQAGNLHAQDLQKAWHGWFVDLLGYQKHAKC